MIRILRPAAPPAILSGKGVEFAAKLCEFYASGQREFTFAATVYAHASVKDALIEAQHGKCCFCERKVFNDGDVEHFRPKGGVRESPGSTLEKPGYYWLAYEWTNLFLSCGPCNSRNKRNLFPLTDGSTRSRCHGDDCSTELPIFIDPSMENPELLIGSGGEAKSHLPSAQTHGQPLRSEHSALIGPRYGRSDGSTLSRLPNYFTIAVNSRRRASRT